MFFWKSPSFMKRKILLVQLLCSISSYSFYDHIVFYFLVITHYIGIFVAEFESTGKRAQTQSKLWLSEFIITVSRGINNIKAEMKACHAEWARQRALNGGVHNYLVFLECAVALKAVYLPSASKELLLFPTYRMEKSSHALVHSYKQVYKSQRKQLIISQSLYNSEKGQGVRDAGSNSFRNLGWVPSTKWSFP